MNYEPMGAIPWDPIFSGITTGAKTGIDIWTQIQNAKIAIENAKTEQQRIDAIREHNRLLAEQQAMEAEQKESTKKLVTYGGIAAGVLLAAFALTQ